MKVIEKIRMTDCSFDKGTNKLSFTIKLYTWTPKIVRYEQVNYVRYPIYKGYSERTKVIKKFDRVINPIRFVNEEILELDLEKHFILSIIEKINVIPEWRKKELELKRILGVIDTAKQKIRNYNREKKWYRFKKTDFNEEPSNFWLRLIFAFFTFGFSFIGYNSKKQVSLNKQINKENKEWNASHKIKIDQENPLLLKEITSFNEECNRNISDYWNLYHKTKNKEIIWWDKEFHDGWKDLKLAADFSFQNLNGEKGVYIIRNETNKKHYVGQAKDLSVRLNQHFLDSKIIKTKNEELAKDWYRGDYFCYKYHPCQTKDGLDSLEKRKIEEYDAFRKGYNKTGGNL